VAWILEAFNRLSADPRGPGSEKLSSLERYRVRKGSYRVVYEIKDDERLVLVVKVAHGRNVY
jgi:mRNA interferase RelE/StbE